MSKRIGKHELKYPESGVWGLEDVYQYDPIIPPGEHVFTATGNHTWTVPAGVTSVCVVCVGGGGAGQLAGSYSNGGAGGGLGWKNDIPVVPGSTIAVKVGNGGAEKTSSTSSYDAPSGTESYFIDATTVAGLGGMGGRYSTSTSPTTLGGGFVGDGGGRGGHGGHRRSYAYAYGGGGAGGYSGPGGTGGEYNTTRGEDGQGGGGGGGGGGGSSDYAGSGGGVGIYGEGANGTGVMGSTSNATATAKGGSGGQNGANGPNGYGGAFGGGGGAADGVSGEACRGGHGAVRIIWGTGRAFPSTSTEEAASNGNVSTN